jgi:hypothetical protein
MNFPVNGRTMRLLLLALLLCPAAGYLSAETANQNAEKALSLLRADNFDFRSTNSPTVWSIHFPGNHMKDIKVVVAVGDDPHTSLVVFVTVAEKKRLPITTDFMRALLKEAHNVDRVKIEFDRDEDLSVRIDAALRITDAAEFKFIVNQVEHVSDELYGMIQPQLGE